VSLKLGNCNQQLQS